MTEPDLAPMLATAGDLPPDDRAYAFEFKWDGIRALVINSRDGMRILTRNGRDVHAAFPELSALHSVLRGRDVALDGEIVALDDKGRTDFGLLQQRLHITDPHLVRQRAQRTPVSFFAFDILRLDGKSLMERPYAERRLILDSLQLTGPHWATPAYHVGSGKVIAAVSREQGIEGVVAKRIDSPYRPGQRTRDWIKVSNLRRQEFVVGGWTKGLGSRRDSFGALLIGYHDAQKRLVFAGGVGTGFSDETLGAVRARLDALASTVCPFAPGRELPTDAHWVLPQLVVEVRFRTWTQHGHVRHASFLGIRPDKPANHVVLERPIQPDEVISNA